MILRGLDSTDSAESTGALWKCKRIRERWHVCGLEGWKVAEREVAPTPRCPAESSPAPGVLADSRRESTDRTGMPHPRHFSKRGCKRLKTKDGRRKKSDKRVEEAAGC